MNVRIEQSAKDEPAGSCGSATADDAATDPAATATTATTAAGPPTGHGPGPATLTDYAREHGLIPSSARPEIGAYARTLWRHRHFVWAFAVGKTRAAYTGARLGQLWQVLTPLVNALIYYVIFGILLGRRGDVTDYIPFLLTGIYFFHFTQRSIEAAARSIQGNIDLVRAMRFPRASLPLASTVAELHHLAAALPILGLLLLVRGEYPTWHWLPVIPVLALQMMFNMGVGLVVARIGAFIPDLSQLLPFALRLWLYSSGIFFAIFTLAAHAPSWVMRLLEANPGAIYVELARRALITSYRHNLHGAHVESARLIWIYAVGWAVVALTAGFWFFYRAEHRYGRG